MEMVYRFKIKPGKAGEFVQWTKWFEETLPEPPPGWKYLSTYFVTHGFGEYDAEIRWQVEDYAALGSGPGSEEGQAANREFVSKFVDDRFPMKTTLMKSVDDIFVPDGF